MKKVLIADDHPLFRAAIKEAVKKALHDADIFEAGSLAAAEALLEQHQGQINLLLLDLYLPDVNGFSGLLQIKRTFPALPVVVISACEDAEVIRRAVEFGASGFIPKTLALDDISAAIDGVMLGDIWVPESVDLDAPPVAAQTEGDLTSLTPTQLKVLVMLKNGLLNKQIAYDMNISEATVKAHLTAIFRKLNVRSRTQAVLAAHSLDLP